MLTALAILASPVFLPIDALAACSGSSPTWTAASASQTDVSDCITAATAGDTINIPAGTVSWTSLSINKAVTLAGAGIGLTNIALMGAEDSIIVTNQTQKIRFTAISFSTSYFGTGNHPMLITGTWPPSAPVIFDHNFLVTETHTFMHTDLPGGIIWSENTMSGDHNTGPMTVKDTTNSHGSWTSNPTMGTADTTGLYNHYFENNTVTGMSNGIFDCDDGCRIVVRYNNLTHGMFNSHGRDTSTYGMRQFELYENTYSNGDQFGDTTGCNPPFYDQCIVNIPQAIWIRGGTGVIFNNAFTFGPGNFGTKPVVRINGRAYGQPTLTTIGKTCATIAYPEANQPGQSYVGGVRVTDPIYFWDNTGSWSLAEIDDFGWNDCSNPWSTFFQWGRDAINPALTGGSAKPGYTAYTYPHPLAGATPTCTADHLAFTSQPTGGYTATFLGTVTVGIYCADNTLLTSATSTVTISSKVGDCSGMTLFGTTSGAATGGLFTTTDLSYNAAGSCTLNAAVSGLPNEASDAFTIYNLFTGPGVRRRGRRP